MYRLISRAFLMKISTHSKRSISRCLGAVGEGDNEDKKVGG
jgi:hypothetical protein